MFAQQNVYYNSLQDKRKEFHKQLNTMIDSFQEDMDMEYFTGVEYQREVTCEFIENLMNTYKSTTISEVDENNKVGNSTTAKKGDTLERILGDTLNIANTLKKTVNVKYINENIDGLKYINALFSNYQNTGDIKALSQLYSKQAGGSVNVSSAINTRLNSTHAINSQKSQVGSNPFLNLSLQVFNSDYVNKELIENFDAYSQEALMICNTYIQEVYKKKDVIESYIDDVFTSDVGSLFYFMRQLIFYQNDLTSPMEVKKGGRTRKQIGRASCRERVSSPV